MIIFYILYIYGFIVTAFTLIDAIKTGYWRATLLTQLALAVFALGTVFFYGSSPGVGKSPGLTYLDEIVYNLGMSAIYFTTLVITIITRFAQKSTQQRNLRRSELCQVTIKESTHHYYL